MDFSVFRQMLTGGARELIDNKEILNKINVFPIPDGDTGTNMSRTIMGLIRTLQGIGERDLTDKDFDLLYNGILMASQGNSGVILSQWFKGFLASIRNADEITALSMNEAFLYAVESAYSAVVAPVEGTFLTVAREAQEMTEEELEEDASLETFLQMYVENAKTSLAGTPDKLPVLKEAGVVDSGGMGFVFFVSGMLTAVDGSKTVSMLEFTDLGSDSSDSELAAAAAEDFEPAALDEFGYCTEVILQLDQDKESVFSETQTIAWLERIGESTVLVRNGSQVKLHVHTKKPEEVLTYFHEYGEFRKIKIENMSLQHHEMYAASRKEKAVVAVVNGQGAADTFASLGADVVLQRSAFEELSVGDISNAVYETNAEHVILLVDDKNLHLVIVGVKQACPNVDLYAIDTFCAADIYAALSILDINMPLDKIVEEMQEAVRESVTVIIKQADTVSDFHNLDIRKDDYIASVNGEYTENHPDLGDVLKEAAGMIEDAEDKESVFVFCSDQEALEEFRKYCDVVKEAMPDAELFLEVGGQQENLYMISIQ